MNWNLAVEKNLEALKRILTMLVAMVGMTAGGDSGSIGIRQATLPRHLHRFVLGLLRPAESATRRLIIVAARGLVVKLPKPPTQKSEPRPPRPDPRAMPEWARLRLQHGLPIEFPRGEPIPLWAQETPAREEPVRRPRVPFFPMYDPMKRFDRKPPRRRIPEDRMPRIALLNDDGWSAPLHLRQAPPPPPPPTPDDPLDAGSIHRRLERIGRALDDLPRQAQRFARWQARRDARMALTKNPDAGASNLPPPLAPPHKGEGDLPPAIGGGTLEGFRQAEPPRSPPPPCGDRCEIMEQIGPDQNRGGNKSESMHDPCSRFSPLCNDPPCGEGLGVGVHVTAPAGSGGGFSWEELGVTPEALALCQRARSPGRNAQPYAQTTKPRRFTRVELLRPGRPPGWRRKPTHEIHEILNDLHGLAVWARDGP